MCAYRLLLLHTKRSVRFFVLCYVIALGLQPVSQLYEEEVLRSSVGLPAKDSNLYKEWSKPSLGIYSRDFEVKKRHSSVVEAASYKVSYYNIR